MRYLFTLPFHDTGVFNFLKDGKKINKRNFKKLKLDEKILSGGLNFLLTLIIQLLKISQENLEFQKLEKEFLPIKL